MDQIITSETLGIFKITMQAEEKSHATIEKYVRDIQAFQKYLGTDKAVTKDSVIFYKQYLSSRFALTSANSMLASLNCFFRIMNWTNCRIRSFKIQREAFRLKEKELTKDEYIRLLETAKQKKQTWLQLLMKTICSTGIRVSELPFVTVESLATRRARVSLKGKTRTVLLPLELCRQLRQYVKMKGIRTGSVFVTRSGKPIDRSNICHAMKKLCEAAGIDRSKVFPHNLRHLFAVTYYSKERDISHLADLLGHSNINTTRIYTLVSSEEQEAQINQLGLVI